MTDPSEDDRIHLSTAIKLALNRLAVLGDPAIQPARPASIKLRDAWPIPRSQNLAYQHFPQNFRVST
jgi:hypothetical protein